MDNVLSSVQPLEAVQTVPGLYLCHWLAIMGPLACTFQKPKHLTWSMQNQPIPQLLRTSSSVNLHLAADVARIAHFSGIKIIRGLVPSCRLK